MYCVVCGEYANGHKLWSGAEDCICDYCYEQRAWVLRPYDYWPARLRFHRGDKKMSLKSNPRIVYFGVEIEWGNNYPLREELWVVSDFERYFWFTHDGSVPDCAEISTHPFTYLAYKKWYKKKVFEPLFDIVNKRTDVRIIRGGLHVHISKAPLTETEQLKIYTFINNNNNWPYIRMMFRRHNQRYAAKNNNVEKAKMVWMLDALHPNKYELVNLLPPHTIEIRGWRAPLVIKELDQAIEFCDALVRFAKATSVARLGWYDFVNFLTQIEGHEVLKRRVHFVTKRAREASF